MLETQRMELAAVETTKATRVGTRPVSGWDTNPVTRVSFS